MGVIGIAGAHILIGTPGRICAVFEKYPQFQMAVKALEVFILDEADKLLDMGFHRAITSITRYVAEVHQVSCAYVSHCSSFLCAYDCCCVLPKRFQQ